MTAERVGSHDDDDDSSDPTVVVSRRRSPIERASAPLDDETTPRPRRAPHDDTVRVRRTALEPAPATPDPSPEAASAGRRAYSPDPESLRAPYAARPVAPLIALRTERPSPMAQSSVDGEAVDRSLRGKARRRAVGLAVVATGVVLIAAGLLALLVLGVG